MAKVEKILQALKALQNLNYNHERNLMKKLIATSLLLTSLNAYANISSTVTVASNYIWRGLSFSTTNAAAPAAQGLPVLQGTMDYTHSSGFAFGTFVGNSDSTNLTTGTAERDTETDLNASYTYKISDEMTTGLYAFWYNYLNNPDNNSMEYIAFLTWNSVRLDVSHMPKYFGVESANTYAKLGVRHNLTEKFGVLAHVGMSSFEKEVKVLTKNYSDHRVGLFYAATPFTVEVAYTNTDRKTYASEADFNASKEVEMKDKAVTLSISAAL